MLTGSNPALPPENLLADGFEKQLFNAIESLNKHTHIEPSTINIAPSLVTTEVDAVLAAVEKLLSAIGVTHESLITALWDHVDASSVDEALRETIGEIDELATHHTIEEVCAEEVEIVRIDSGHVHFAAHGTVSCELQYGSNSDRRRGDAVVMADGFPFTCELQSPVDDPKAVYAEEGSFFVDTSSWRNGD